MQKTKKMLAPFDPSHPERIINDFVYPDTSNDHQPFLCAITNEKVWSAGIVVFIGREVSTDDILARFPKAPLGVPRTEKLKHSLDHFIMEINNFKIGDIVRIAPAEEEFSLIRLEKPGRMRSKLP